MEISSYYFSCFFLKIISNSSTCSPIEVVYNNKKDNHMNKLKKHILVALLVSFGVAPVAAFAKDKVMDCVKLEDGTFICYPEDEDCG